MLTAQRPAKESTKHFQTKSMRLIYDLYGESAKSEEGGFTCVWCVHVKWKFFLFLESEYGTNSLSYAFVRCF